MFGFFRLLKGLYYFSDRANENDAEQRRENYSITHTQEGPERYITYVENGLKIDVIHEFSYWNDAVIFTDSLNYSNGKSNILNPNDYDRILRRLIRYFSRWGGKVTLNDQKLQNNDNLKAMLNRAGIEFTENEAGLIMFSADADEMRANRIPPFNK